MSSAQFEIGQIIAYSTNGICVVDSIEQLSFSAGQAKEPYYVLRQHRNPDNRYFVPLKNEALTSKMRELMQKEDIEDILMGLSSDGVIWCTDRRERNDYFRNILHAGISSELLDMIMCIYEHKRKLAREGKRLPIADANILKQAEKLVEEEFGWVLGIDSEEVPKYIRKRLHIPEDED